MIKGDGTFAQFPHLCVAFICLGLGFFLRSEPSPYPIPFRTTNDVPMLLAVGLLGVYSLEIWFRCLHYSYYRLREVTGIGIFRASSRVVLGSL